MTLDCSSSGWKKEQNNIGKILPSKTAWWCVKKREETVFIPARDLPIFRHLWTPAHLDRKQPGHCTWLLYSLWLYVREHEEEAPWDREHWEAQRKTPLNEVDWNLSRSGDPNDTALNFHHCQIWLSRQWLVPSHPPSDGWISSAASSIQKVQLKEKKGQSLWHPWERAFILWMHTDSVATILEVSGKNILSGK